MTTTLRGTWTAIEARRDGAAVDLVGNQIEFTGDRFRISNAGRLLFGGGVAVNEAVVPAEIDFRIDEGQAKGQTWSGLFKIEKGLLTICDNAPDPSAPRPRDFDAPKGSGYVCLTFEPQRD